MNEPKEFVTLKNGSQESLVLVNSMMFILRKMVKEKPILAADLIMKARDPNYEFFGDAETLLREQNLLNPDGTIHESTKNIILSAVVGDDWQIVNPIADQPMPKRDTAEKIYRQIITIWESAGATYPNPKNPHVNEFFPSKSGEIEIILDNGAPAMLRAPEGQYSLGGYNYNGADRKRFMELLMNEFDTIEAEPKKPFQETHGTYTGPTIALRPKTVLFTGKARSEEDAQSQAIYALGTNREGRPDPGKQFYIRGLGDCRVHFLETSEYAAAEGLPTIALPKLFELRKAVNWRKPSAPIKIGDIGNLKLENLKIHTRELIGDYKLPWHNTLGEALDVPTPPNHVSHLINSREGKILIRLHPSNETCPHCSCACAAAILTVT